jgi:hypothetical protein
MTGTRKSLHNRYYRVAQRASRDQLMEEAVRMMQSQLRAAPTIKKRAKTVYSQRSVKLVFILFQDRYSKYDPQESGHD